MSATRAPRENAAIVMRAPHVMRQDQRPAAAKIGPELAFGAAVKNREVLGAGGMLALQAAAGNRAVAGLVQAKRERPSTDGRARVHEAAKPALMSGAGVVQRIVGHYKPGTLASTTVAMRGLSLAQMTIVQGLHDDPTKKYTVDQARQLATGSSTSSNQFSWDVTGIGNYATPDSGVQGVLDHFGHPISSVVKTYDDLASRVGHDVGKTRKGALSASTISDLQQHWEASKPLHLSFNPFLNSAWTGNLHNYTGAKTGIPLYSVMRSEITNDFKAESLGKVTLNDVLKQVSGRPSEVHHLLFKAHYPKLATTPLNLMLTERSESEKIAGPGQHELMHMVASGKHPDKFKALLSQYVAEYEKWVQAQTGHKL